MLKQLRLETGLTQAALAEKLGTRKPAISRIKKTDTDLREIDGIQLPASGFADYRADPDRPVPVIYQSGYLTIKGYDPSLRFYTLGYPNAEVKNGFLAFLLPDYTGTGRKLHKIGVEFDKEAKNIGRWITEEGP